MALATTETRHAAGVTMPARSRAAWTLDYQRKLAITDTAIVLMSTFGAQGLRDEYFGNGWWHSTGHLMITAVVSLGWLIALHTSGARAPRVTGVGVQEYRVILGATVKVFGVFAIWSLLIASNIGRGYMLVALPLGTTLLLLSRMMWRGWLQRERAQGRALHQVVLLGSPETAYPVAADLLRNRAAGYQVIGRVGCGDNGFSFGDRPDVPFLGEVDDLLTILDRVGADTVVVTGSQDLSPEQLRTLGWELEDERFNLVLTPSLISVGGPRVRTSEVTGLSLLHVDTPRYEGLQRIGKRTFDLIGAGIVLTLAAIPMLVVATVIRFTSTGPVLYRQTRIGRGGAPFQMIKFRSMRQGADAELQALLAEARGDDDTVTPLFKVENDPRITPIGRFIRKYSIDELPQLFNVVKGDMSLVGPRPQVAGEVELYDNAAHRRHMVQPGMTGLWQVSGRSTLDWEDAIALDLHYVANWSVTTDISILARTVRAVVAPGATAH